MKHSILLKSILYAILVMVALIISWNYPFIKEESPITANTLQVIQQISSKPHSFRNPEARGYVRDYLISQLKESGLQPIQFTHDSIPTRTGEMVSLANIYTHIDPPNATDSTQYVLLIAHYDSTGKPSGLDSTRFSYGAADDGYGVGIICGLLNDLLSTRSKWKQGIKILFTDLEEEHTAGMKKAVESNPEIFNGVNLAINVEARGVKGPALLFETSPGNQKLMDLYQYASQPYAYSLTGVVYRFMPNYTDFGVIKYRIPGMNFAVIDNLNHYHTHLDNIEAVSRYSLAHYAAQLQPILSQYLIRAEHGSKDTFYTDQSDCFFLIPPFGLFRCSDTGWLLINIGSWILLVIAGYVYYRKHPFRLVSILKKQTVLLIIPATTFLLGTAFSWLIAHFAQQPFRLTQTLYITHDLLWAIFFIVVWTIILFWVWSQLDNIQKRDWWWNLSLTINLFSCILFWLIEENFFILIPAVITLIAGYILEKRVLKWILPGLSLILLLIETAFLKQLFLALTFGSLGILAVIGIFTFLPVCVMGYYYIKRF